MMHRPWAPGTIDEWLPRSLRLCWGGSGDASGDATGGTGGAATGGGDWGSAGFGDFSGMNATDSFGYANALADSPGGFYDTGGPGIAPGALGAEFGGTFGLSGVSGQPGDPQGAFGAELDAGGGGLSGVGRAIESWGRDTPATQAGYAGSFADLSGGFGGVGSPGTGGTGGYGGDYGGGYGGGGRSGGFTGGGFTGGGGGGGGRSSGGRGSVTDTTPGFTGHVSGGTLASTGHSGDEDVGGEPSGGPSDIGGSRGEGPETSEADTPAPEAPSFGSPTTSHDTTMESGPAEATTSTDDTTTIGGDPALSGASVQDAPSAFGPQSLDRGTPDYQGSPYADMGVPSQAYADATQALSNLTQTALEPAPTDYQGAPYADMGLPFEAGSRDFFSGGRDFWGNVLNPSPIETSKAWNDINTWLSPTSQQTFNEIANLPSALNPSVPTMLQAPSTMDLQALGEQGRAGQQTDLASQLGAQDIAPGGIDPGAAQYATAPDPATQLGVQSIADPIAWGSVFEGAPGEIDWGAVFEGVAPPPAEPDPSYDPTADQATYDFGGLGQPHGQTDFGGWADTPTVDPTMESGQPAAQPTTDNATTLGSDPALSGDPIASSYDFGGWADMSAAAAEQAAKDVGAPQAAQDAAAQAAQAAALNGASPTAQAVAAMAAALDKGATQAQADAIGAAVHAAAVSKSVDPVPGTVTPSIVSKEAFEALSKGMELPGINLPGSQAFENPDISPVAPASVDWGSVFEGAAPPSEAQPAPPQETQPAPSPQAQPGLADMRGQPGTTATIPGGRTTDFNYQPSSTPPTDPAQHGEGNPGGEGDPDQGLTVPPAPPAAPEPGGVTAADRAARGPNAQPEPQHVQDARQYLLSTARPGDTMNQQGPDVAIARLEPNFAVRLANAIREARANGLPNASVFSAFRAPNMGANPGYAVVSQHGRGIAVDMSGIGRPGSREAQLWYDIATRNGLYNPYGANHRVEWNHYQAVPETGRQTANRLGANPRTAPASMVPTWDRVGVRPVAPADTQVAGVPTPRGRPAEAEAGVQPGAEQYVDVSTVTAPPTVPAALPPPQEAPAPRPPADVPIDIPVQTVPPRAGLPDPVMLARTASQIAADMAARGPRPSSQAEGQAALTGLARALAQAGIPAAIAARTLTDIAREGARQAGYDPDGIASSFISSMTGTAMQGYRAAPSRGEPQGPPAPADLAPGKRSEAPFGQQFAGLSPLMGAPPSVAPPPIFSIPTLPQLSPIITPPPPPLPPPNIRTEAPGLLDFLSNFNPISTAEARGGRSQPSQLTTPQADPGTIQGRLSSARSGIINELQTNQGLRNTLDLIVTGEVGSQGRAAVLGWLETAMNKAAAEASREGRAPTGRDLLNYLNDRSYFPDTWGKIESGKIKGGALTDDLLSEVGGGSNTTKGSTGNSSAKSEGSRFGGNPTNATIGKEHYGVENYAHHVGWYNALGVPDMPAVGAMPPAMPAPNPLRGLAKGGRVDDDEAVVVGEQGPEVFVPDRPGTVFPHIPQPARRPAGGSDRYWPKMPAVGYPGRYGDVEREMMRQTLEAQDPSPTLMDLIDSGRLRLNAANWQKMFNDPALIALGQSRIEDRTMGDFIPLPDPAMGPPDPASPMAQQLGYGRIRRPDSRPLRIGRQSY